MNSLTGSAFVNTNEAFPTAGGDFVITDLSTATFTATLGTTAFPEPASLALLGTALAGFGLIRRRRRKPV